MKNADLSKQPTKLQNAMRTVRRYALPLAIFVYAALMLEGCIKSSPENKNNGSRPQITNNNFLNQQQRKAHANLSGDSLTIVAPDSSSGTYHDKHPIMIMCLKRISANTLQNASISEPDFDKMTGITTFRVTPRNSQGWMDISCTQNGLISVVPSK